MLFQTPLFLLYIAFTLNITWGLTVNNYEIRDLESNTTYFQDETQHWLVSGNLTLSTTSTCAGTWILGGYGIIGNGGSFKRVYSSLPSHNIVFILINFWLIDLDTSTDLFQILVDGQVLNDYNSNFYSHYNSSGATSICGGMQADYSSAKIQGQVSHSSTTLTLTINSMFDSSTDIFSFGIRQVYLLFQTVSGSSTLMCNFQASSSSPSCLCPGSTFNPVGASGCSSCNSLCKTCIKTASSCTSCISGYSFVGSTCLKCDATCDQCNGTAPTDCIRCPIGSFLYPNQSCLAQCLDPFVIKTEGEYQSCNLPCSNSDYYYQNKTCLPTCPLYYNQTTSNGLMYCYSPCAPSEYFYQNKTCLSNCESPYIQQNIDQNLTLCNLPCPSGEYYMQGENTCTATCNNIIYQDTNLKVCQSSSQSTSDNTSSSSNDGVSSITGALQSISNAAFLAGDILRSNNFNSAFVTAIAKLVKYVKFLQIPLDEEIRDALRLNSSGAFSLSYGFTMKMPQSIQNKFEKRSLPAVLEETGYHSSFIVNHWETMTTYIFLTFLGIGTLVLEFLTRSLPRFKRFALVVRRLRVLLTWNFFLFTFFNTYDDITFFAILEFMTTRFDSIASVMSFIVCLFVISLGIHLLLKIVVVSREVLQLKKRVASLDKSTNSMDIFHEKWEKYQVFYAGFKDRSFFDQAYLFWFTLRIILCFILVGVLYNHPLIQTMQITLLSLAMLVYLVIRRPIRDPVNYFVLIVYEIFIFIVNLCAFILTAANETGKLTPSLQTQLSRTILIGNTAINFSSNFFSWLYVVLGIWSAFKKSRKGGLLNKLSWLNVFVAPYQNPGMDFIEKSDHPDSKLVELNTNEDHFRSNLKKPIDFKFGFGASLKSIYKETDISDLSKETTFISNGTPSTASPKSINTKISKNFSRKVLLKPSPVTKLNIPQSITSDYESRVLTTKRSRFAPNEIDLTIKLPTSRTFQDENNTENTDREEQEIQSIDLKQATPNDRDYQTRDDLQDKLFEKLYSKTPRNLSKRNTNLISQPKFFKGFNQYINHMEVHLQTSVIMETSGEVLASERYVSELNKPLSFSIHTARAGMNTPSLNKNDPSLALETRPSFNRASMDYRNSQKESDIKFYDNPLEDNIIQRDARIENRINLSSRSYNEPNYEQILETEGNLIGESVDVPKKDVLKKDVTKKESNKPGVLKNIVRAYFLADSKVKEKNQTHRKTYTYSPSQIANILDTVNSESKSFFCDKKFQLHIIKYNKGSC